MRDWNLKSETKSDKDAILIEKIGDNNNPYFVSAELLKNISDFEC